MAELARGQNLRSFQALQLDFAAHIRHPERNPMPDGIEERRMRIYTRLFYGNIESFCAKSFKRAKDILGDGVWHALIRDFVHRHNSSSPFFCEIQDEFLEFLATELDSTELPPFLLEICHYDWHQLHLLLAVSDITDRILGEIDDDSQLTISPLAYNLAYGWPVHKISVEFQPEQKPNTPTHLLVYRDGNHEIHHSEVNSRTALLLSQFESPTSVRDSVERFASQFGAKVTGEQRLRFLSETRNTVLELASRHVLVAPADETEPSV